MAGVNDAQRILHDMFEGYKHTSSFKDSAMLEVMAHKREYEKHLDEMWEIARRGNLQQLPIYKKQVRYLTSIGVTTMRNSAGKHKLVPSGPKVTF